MKPFASLQDLLKLLSFFEGSDMPEEAEKIRDIIKRLYPGKAA